jgi:carbonic anhydrase
MHAHDARLGAIEDESARLDRLCELNVIEQVLNVSRTTIVQSAWGRGQELSVHGLIYGIGDGLLRDLGLRVDGRDGLSEAYAEAVRASA